MDIWAPVCRVPNQGVTGLLANDINGIVTSLGPFTGSPSGTDCAAHGAAGDKWQNAYGEIQIDTLTTAGNKAGVLLRLTDSSNYYAAYLTPTTVAIDSVVAAATTSLLSQAITLGTMPSGSAVSGYQPAFRAEIDGDLISVYWRGVFQASVRDTALTAPGFVSMFIRANSSANVTIQRFEAGPLPTLRGSQSAAPRPLARRLG